MKTIARIAIVAMALCCASATHAQGINLLPDGYPGGNAPRGAPLNDCAGGEIYDDGGAENGYSGNPATVTNYESVSQFTPASYPARYARVCVGLVSLGGANLDFEIEIRDDDGVAGDPGTLLGTVPASVTDLPAGLPCTFYPVDISALDIEVPSGSVWIGVRWNPQTFPSRFLCADESPATTLHPGRINFNDGLGWQPTQNVFPAYRAKLVRAELGSEADLAIEKTGSTDGTQATWTLTATNNGPDGATDVVVTDNFPACSSFVSDDCGGTGAAPWTWTIGALADQATATCNVVLDVSGCPSGPLSNTAEAAAAEADPDPLNNSDTASVSLLRSDLSLAKTGTAGGGTATWTIEVSNAGPDAATGIVVSDSLAACSTLVSDDCGGIAGTPWQWNIGALASAASVSCNLIVDTSSCGSGVLSNTATVSAAEADADPSNNSDSADITVVSSDLAISKSGVLDGTTATWSITVSNSGPDAATGVVVADALAACTTYVSDTCGGANLPPWTLAVGNLASGASLDCEIEVDTSACPPGALSNTASVSGDQFDPTPANDSAAASVSVVDADLSLSRTSASSGSLVTWSFVVANAGPADATGVVLTDTIASCASYVSDTCGGADLSPWTVALGTITAGDSASCDLVIDIAGCPIGNVTNTASVSANEPDPQPGNNSAAGSISRFPPAANVPFLGGVGTLALLLGLMFTALVMVRRRS